MRLSLAPPTNCAAFHDIALRDQVSEVRVFGSVSHGNNREGRDLDLLVDSTSETTLMDFGAIRYELRRR